MDAKWLRNSFVYLVILVLVIAIAYSLMSRGTTYKATNLGQVMSYLVNDTNGCASGHGSQSALDKVTVDGGTVHLDRSTACGGDKWSTQLGDNDSFPQLLKDNNISITKLDYTNTAPSQLGNWLQLIGGFLPLLVFGGLLFLMMRQAQGSNNQAMSFGKSRARMFTGNRPSVTFADVAGVEEAKQELAEVVEFLRYPEKFASLGARIPRGVLLVGSPGTGKTLLSRAVAGEAGVPFFSISGSEFVEMFVGVGASRVRDLFEQAKRNSPCIVFVDEIDAVGRQRGAGLGGSHDEREQTLNQILVEMDGFDTNTNVIVIAATNRPDVLDPALLRPGRFDRQVILDRPDIRGRLAVLEVHARGKPLDKSASLDTLAKQTPGFSGADLANLLNEAAILAARRNRKVIGMQELEEAIDRVVAGPERKSRIISEHEKRVTAFHEVGHALVAQMLPNLDPLHKVTIIARGMAGGFTQLLPSEDRYFYTRSYFEDTLAFSLGGQAAEMLIFGEMTTGAENDIERSTKLARKMVTEYGMSDKLGPMAYGHKEEMVFLGRDLGEQRNYSEVVAVEIDSEVRRLVTTAFARAKEILEKHREKLVLISERLITEETLDKSQFETLLGLSPLEASMLPSGRSATNGSAPSHA
ncbi:MAG TPA: ATP-dependent zinc metalloprotease FtsH [Chloroflexota bacterium]|nr:ATP-dependent zinc metalloprotease FtsH [Chloroflexota bacterium]